MKNYTHSYYVYAMKIDRDIIKIDKKKLEKLIKLNNLPFGVRYQNLYKAKILKSKKFLSRIFETNKDINKYIKSNNAENFKNTEELQKYEYLDFGICLYDYNLTDLKIIFDKFYKFWNNLKKFKN